MKTRQRLALSKPPIPSADRKLAVEGVAGSSRLLTQQRQVQDVTATSVSSSASPARRFHTAKQDEDILWSPQHLKMHLRQEDLCSQTVNSQEILWDYTSPDAIRQLKRIRKCRNGDNMSDIVLRFLDDNGEVSTTTPPLLSLWMESKLVDDTNKPVRGPTVAHQKKNNRNCKRRRRPTGHEEDETKDLMKRMIQRCEVIEEPIISDGGNDHNNEMKESVEKLQSCKNVSPKSSKCTSLFKNSPTTEQLKTSSPADKSPESDLWTDDDLFEDNSFILEATQLPAGKRKSNSPSREQPSVKNKRYTFSLTADSNIIPPTFVASSNTRPIVNTSQNKHKNIYHPSIGKTCMSDISTNNNSFKKHSSFDDKSTSTGSCGPGHSYVMSKSPWRRSNSFSGSRSPVNRPRKQPSCTVSRSESEHKDVNIEINNNRCNGAVATRCVQDSCKPNIAKTCDNRLKSFVKNVSMSVDGCNKNDCLDTSISDELLYQLAEPDELLESQLTPEGSAHKICTELDQDDLFDDDMDFVGSVNTNLKNITSVSKKNSEKGQCLKFDGQPRSRDKILQRGSSQMLVTSDCVAPTQKPTQSKFSFKNAGLKSKQANVANSDHVPSYVNIDVSNRNAVSITKKGLQKETATASKCMELGSNQDTDEDSFLGDDALFESQILAMLDEVESQATQKTPHVSPVASNKYSTKEIERKRLAALEKKKKNHPL